eukprot:756506-Hanusia_phi.AAC.3
MIRKIEQRELCELGKGCRVRTDFYPFFGFVTISGFNELMRRCLAGVLKASASDSCLSPLVMRRLPAASALSCRSTVTARSSNSIVALSENEWNCMNVMGRKTIHDVEGSRWRDEEEAEHMPSLTLARRSGR